MHDDGMGWDGIMGWMFFSVCTDPHLGPWGRGDIVILHRISLSSRQGDYFN
jgi:hypothetical protein